MKQKDQLRDDVFQYEREVSDTCVVLKKIVIRIDSSCFCFDLLDGIFEGRKCIEILHFLMQLVR